MASDYIYEEESLSQNHEKMDKWLKRLIILVGGVLGVACLWFLGITPLLPLSSIEVSGIPGVSRSYIAEMAGIKPHTSYASVDINKAEKALENLYLVGKAEVSKYYPDTVRIHLEPRLAAAVTLVSERGRDIPVFIDKTGMVIKVGDGLFPGRANSDPWEDLPLITGTGLDSNKAFPGAKLDTMYTSLLSKLETIRNLNPELLAGISEIKIHPRPYGGFDLVIYPMDSTVRFKMGPSLDENTIRYMLLMIEVFKKSGVNAEEVDMRSNTTSYVLKEAYPGK